MKICNMDIRQSDSCSRWLSLLFALQRMCPIDSEALIVSLAAHNLPESSGFRCSNKLKSNYG